MPQPDARTPDAALVYLCPDCDARVGSWWDTLKHMKDEHASDHPGKEPVAHALTYQLRWEGDDDGDE